LESKEEEDQKKRLGSEEEMIADQRRSTKQFCRAVESEI